ncbi:MAG: sulfurtransferase [Candidatus Dormibacteria bacterium]
MSSDDHPSCLVSTEWVAQNLDSGIRVVEVDEDTEAYVWGHIPGAVALNWRTDMQEQVQRNVVGPEGFARVMAEKGIRRDDTVILYGGNNNWFAAYAYWLFRLYRHPDVKLMDGGRKKWELEDRVLTDVVPEITPSTYEVGEPDPSIRAYRDGVISSVGRVPMVDVRSPDEFSGKLAAPPHLPTEQAQRSGHIPGAVNIPWSRAANEDGTFRSVAELREIYLKGAGIKPDQPVVAYCRIGERSSHTWFVLHELLGFKQVGNYDGSWTEYGSLVDVPIQRDYREEA